LQIEQHFSSSMRRFTSPLASRGRAAGIAVALLLAAACVPAPTPPTPPTTSSTAVVDASRAMAARLWATEYLPSVGASSPWTGSVASCASGAVSAGYQTAVLRRINYFRAMAGLSNVQLDTMLSAKAGEAALMMVANDTLSHDPPVTWLCYTADGAEAASRSNLFLGRSGPEAIDGYIEDGGGTNLAAGHRRWLLHPPTARMGMGDIPGRANALWVVGGAGGAVTPRDGYVAWPPKGYVPKTLVFPRWSFALDGADLVAASVSLTRNGKACPVTVVHRDRPPSMYGDLAMVWDLEPRCLPGTSGDVVYRVTVSGAVVGGMNRSYSYTVTAFTP
jgi:uncharacterized protein YkwD